MRNSKPRMNVISHSIFRMTAVRVSRTLALGAFLAGVLAAIADDFQGATHLMPFDEETINYSKQK